MFDKVMELVEQLAVTALAATGDEAAAAVVEEVKPLAEAAVKIVEAAANGESVSDLIAELETFVAAAKAKVAELETPPSA
jgi:hypothetical protein